MKMKSLMATKGLRNICHQRLPEQEEEVMSLDHRGRRGGRIGSFGWSFGSAHSEIRAICAAIFVTPRDDYKLPMYLPYILITQHITHNNTKVL